MTCDDFLSAWNARIDDPGAFGMDCAETLDAHAATCEPCRRLASGFRLVSLSLPTPAVPDGLSDRILAAWAVTDARHRRNQVHVRWAWATGLAAAAVALAIFAPWTPRGGRGPDFAKKSAPPVGNLSLAWAQATSATLDLARETYAPAARLGQDVSLASLPREFAWPIGIESATAPSELLESVTRKVNSRVQPLSGSARRAFSFLIAPTPEAAGPGTPKDEGGA